VAKATPLFDPLAVRSRTLANRLVMSSMTRYFSPGGAPGPDVASYYRRRAEGGIGLILTEGTGIDDPSAVDNSSIPVMFGETALAGWKLVVDEVHSAGSAIFPQLRHQGALRDSRISKHPEILGLRPSGFWGPLGVHSLEPDYIKTILEPTRPMTESEIANVIAAFGRSAAHARALGFDGVAIHGAHGYLIDTFLWDETNRRTDRYGGDGGARTRFAVEIVKAIRVAIGPDLPILFRFSQHKTQDYNAKLARTPRELEDVLVPLAEASVDVFDASARRFDAPAFEGSPLNLAGWAKKITGKIAMTVGGIGLDNTLPETFKSGSTTVNNIPQLLERFNRGEFDLVGIGRSLLSDAYFARRLRTGEPLLPFDKGALSRLL
jgi:2,4-dienoyl-CoA reductase-like NADH-dependent reductase (Old Yellow Enzyme family)